MNEIETHPFVPFLPSNAKLLILGTFPPAPKRWSMEWYYPNFINDMWRIMGYIFFQDKNHFVDNDKKTFHLTQLQTFMKKTGIAFYDTAYKIIRTTGTASDKDLKIVEVAPLDEMLRNLPECRAVVTAGQLATDTFSRHYHIDSAKMKMGEYRTFLFEGREICLYRQPSTSRAYPMKIEEKAKYYQKMLEEIGIIG